MLAQADHVELTEAAGSVRRFPLEGARLIVGRSPSADIWLADASVSRMHARLDRREDGGWSVVDLGSTNRTRVNGREVQMAAMHDDDCLQIGNYQLAFRSPPGTRAAADLELELVPGDTAQLILDGDSVIAGKVIGGRC